jgi:hypothetical protein
MKTRTEDEALLFHTEIKMVMIGAFEGEVKGPPGGGGSNVNHHLARLPGGVSTV